MTHYDANDGWTVRGKLKATAQGSAPGEAVLLDSNGKLPGNLIESIVEEFTVSTTAWSGTGPYTASIVLNNTDKIAVPDFAPNAPNDTQRIAFASARISVTAVNTTTKAVTLVADGDKPTVALPCLMTGLAGIPSGKWTSSFPGGLGGSGDTYTLTVTITPTDTSDPEGITVTVTDSQSNVQTDVTDVNGQCSFTVALGETYDVDFDGDAVEVECSASQQVTISNTSTQVSASCTGWPTISISAGAAGAGCAYSIVGNTSYSGVLNSSGAATVVVEPDTYVVSMTAPAGYFTPASQTKNNCASGNDYAVSWTLQAKPVVTIQITDARAQGNQQGRTITVSKTGDTCTGTTDANGESVITLNDVGTYTISITNTPNTYFAPADQTLTVAADGTYTVSITLNKKPILSVTVSDNSGSGLVDHLTVHVQGTTDSQFVNTGSTGNASFVLQEEGSYTISITNGYSADYVTPSTSSVVAAANQVHYVAMAIDKKPVITVTVTDSSSASIVKTSIKVKATNTLDSTKYDEQFCNSSGVATLKVPAAGTYTISITSTHAGCDTTDTDSVTVALNGTDTAAVEITDEASGGFLFSMTFDPTTFQTAPGSALTYGDDCAGYTPVSGAPSSLGPVSTPGSWAFNNDGSSDNPFLNECFYATFKDNGNGLEPFEKLNPNNLTQKIAEWDPVNKVWDTTKTGSSSITTLNTMFCYPALYRAATATKISISDDSSNGAAYGATIDGHTYQYVALGVYGGYNDSNVLKSLSGKAATASTTRPNFRTYAKANTVRNGKAMVWNLHQWQDWRIITYFAMRHFNGQSQIGQGGKKYNGSGVSGLGNSAGPWGGDNNTTVADSEWVKALIEDPWGYKYWFIDDIVFNNVGANEHEIWAGQNSNVDDTYDTTNKTKIMTSLLAGGSWLYALAISTDPVTWGFITQTGGSVTVGLCDGVYLNNGGTAQTLAFVGGASTGVSDGDAGPGFLRAADALDFSHTATGLAWPLYLTCERVLARTHTGGRKKKAQRAETKNLKRGGGGTPL